MSLSVFALFVAVVEAVILDETSTCPNCVDSVESQSSRASALLQVGRSRASADSSVVGLNILKKTDKTAEEMEFDGLDGLLSPLNEEGFSKVVSIKDIDQVNQFVRRAGIGMGLPVTGPNAVSHVVTHYYNMAELPSSFADLQSDIEMSAGDAIPQGLADRQAKTDLLAQAKTDVLAKQTQGHVDSAPTEPPHQEAKIPVQPAFEKEERETTSETQSLDAADRVQASTPQVPEQAEPAFDTQSLDALDRAQGYSFVANYGAAIQGSLSGMETGMGSNVVLDEDGYLEVLELKSDHEMEVFVQRVLGNLGLSVVDQNGLKDFVPWVSGQSGSSSFGSVKGKLLNLLGTTNAWVADPNQPPAQQSLAQKSEFQVPLTQDGYMFTANLVNNPKMVSFIDRVASNMGMLVVNHGGVEGLAPYFSGDKQVGSLEGLKSEIEKASNTPGSWVERM